jgi:hypothetical protein
MKTEIETIKYLGVELVINFTVDGKYYPATREQPAEYPEITIEKVFAEDTDIMSILLETQMDDIYNLLIEKIEE